MIRALFIVLAVVVAVLAWVMGMPYLYLLAGVLVLAAVGLLATDWRRAQRKAEQPYTGKSYSQEDELKSLGIMEVREKTSDEPKSGGPPSAAPKKAKDAPQKPPSQNEPSQNEPLWRAAQREQGATPSRTDAPPAGPTADGAPSQADAPRPEKRETTRRERAGDETPRAERPEAMPAAGGSERAGGPERPETEKGEALNETDPLQAVLRPYVEALRAALGAHTVALIAQEELALDYRIEALSSAGQQARAGGTFSTPAPLLSARMAHQAVTVRAVSDAEAAGDEPAVPRAHLGYYREGQVPAIEHVLLAPVRRRDDLATHFLVADAPVGGFADDRPEALAERFADLLGHLLRRQDRRRVAEGATADEDKAAAESASGDAASAAEASEARTAKARLAEETEAEETPVSEAASSGDGHAGRAAQSAAGDSAPGAAEERAGVRPRREIIAEELARARADDTPMALALVYLNRAETLAGNGEAAVREAEQALHQQLEATAPVCRVEPFGELTYGLFYTGALTELEAWAAELERALAAAGPPLDGGVSIGIAMPTGPDTEPEALRAQATHALREAYTTGTCTILE